MEATSPGSKGDTKAGYRAAEAYVRPVPVAIHGTIESYGFDLKNCIFSLELTAPSSTPADYPTEIFIPEFHFPHNNGQVHLEISGGKWEIRIVEDVEGARQQVLRWWHGEGEQKLKITGVRRKRGQIADSDSAGEESYLQAYWEMGKNCTVM
jgi:hypothetical protein